MQQGCELLMELFVEIRVGFRFDCVEMHCNSSSISNTLVLAASSAWMSASFCRVKEWFLFLKVSQGAQSTPSLSPVYRRYRGGNLTCATGRDASHLASRRQMSPSVAFGQSGICARFQRRKSRVSSGAPRNPRVLNTLVAFLSVPRLAMCASKSASGLTWKSHRRGGVAYQGVAPDGCYRITHRRVAFRQPPS